MLKAYLNSPGKTGSIHRDLACGQIQKRNKLNQRVVRIDVRTISTELQNFRDKAHKFGADKAKNDMWLDVDFDDAEFESAVIAHVQKLIRKHYKRAPEHSSIGG